MKTNELKSTIWSKAICILLGLCITIFILSCDKENDGGNGYFELIDSDLELKASAQGVSKTYAFRSSGNWKIEALRKENWIKISPTEGSGDGTFTLTVDKNITPEDRSVILTFMIDGKLQSNMFTIEQHSNTSGGAEEDRYVMLDDLTNLKIPEGGITSRHTIRSTGTWRAAFSDEEADWISIEPMEGVGDTPITLTVDINSEIARTINLNFYLDDVLLPNPLLITQENVEVILEENFEWLSYGSPIFYTTTGEKRIDSWTAEERERGWTTSPSADGVTSTYARHGFVKLGKTNYGSNFISPPLSEVDGTKDLLVKFKAVPYQTAGGARDGTSLKVDVIGPGTVSVHEFDITNWPDYDADPTCTLIWAAADTERSFVITGATAETQICFLGGALDLREASPNKNRIFLDDIIVTVQK